MSGYVFKCESHLPPSGGPERLRLQDNYALHLSVETSWCEQCEQPIITFDRNSIAGVNLGWSPWLTQLVIKENPYE